MKKVLFEISGMKCGNCVSKIQSAFEEIESVTSVSISLDDKNMEVSFDEKLTKSLQLKSKIEELGFSVLKMKKL